MRFLLLFFSCVLFLFCLLSCVFHFYNESIGLGIFWLILSGVNLGNVILASKNL